MATFTRCSWTDGDMVCISAAGHRGRHALRNKEVLEDLVASPPDIGNTEGGEITLPHTTPEGIIIDLPTPAEVEMAREAWTPTGDDFINLKGKAYLPARRRIQWMRGIPLPNPDWTIDTEIVEHERGKLTKPGPVGVGKVEGGFAVLRANVFDETGRLIATGLKSEYSENFTDYLEKAETGAIARALAVAGYGTESALDLDEGVDAGRIADAPVSKTSPGPVVLGPSSVAGLGRGGKTDGASVAQIRQVAELTKELEMGHETLAVFIENVLHKSIGALPSDEMAANRMIATFLSEQSGKDVGELILALSVAADAALEEEEKEK